MPIAVRVNLSIPGDSELGPKLLARAAKLQREENKLAKAEGREARDITIQEIILNHCAAAEGVEIDPPTRGRRWPAKSETENKE